MFSTSASVPVGVSDARRQLLLWSRFEFDESLPNSQNRGLSPVIDLKFVKDIAYVVLNRLLAEVQAVGDFFVGLAVCNQTKHGDFPFGQIVLDPRRLLALFL